MQPVLASLVLCVGCGSGRRLRLSCRRRLSFPLRTLLGDSNRYAKRGPEPQESRGSQGSTLSAPLLCCLLIELTESLMQAWGRAPANRTHPCPQGTGKLKLPCRKTCQDALNYDCTCCERPEVSF